MTIGALAITLIASNLANIVARESLGFVPVWLTAAKVMILLGLAALLWRTRYQPLARYSLILGAVTTSGYAFWMLGRTAAWQSLFDPNTFAGYHGSMIWNKFLSSIPIIGLLLWLLKSAQDAYLVKGDLSVKAEPIRWLGIHANWVSWRRLAVFSAFAISGGTLLLTLFTVTGFRLPETIRNLPGQMPIIVLLALVNSVSEGFLFRNAVLGPLRDALPKDHVLLIAAVFFGLAHFYGVPAGALGVVMSGILGWFLCRSMYETGGLVAPWIIHFMQDLVIFATLFLLTTFI